jgi:hypothetical protein
MLVNTQEFREAAIYYDKHGKYDCGVKGSQYYKDWVGRELDRCINGMTSGGMFISGYHYHYLNYCRIQLVEETFGEVHDTRLKNARKVGKRVESFPAFWDLDYMYFMALDIAENGITPDKFKELQKIITLNIKDDQLGGGHHLIWLKGRGAGASFKGASLPQRNLLALPKSKSYLMANEKEYLLKDGIWSKFLEYRDWTNSNASFFRRDSEVKNDRNLMHIRASIDNNGVEVGYLSEVMGVSLMNNPQKARGKRGKIVLWEEFGKFPNADIAWEIALQSMQELDITFGTMVAFGTGGVEGSDFEALRKMFYNPRDYNLLCFDNMYDAGMSHTECGLFTPAYMNPSYKDDYGNSKIEVAKALLNREREQAENSKDPTIGPRKKAELPYTPQEAVLNTAENIFASETLSQHKNRVEQEGLYKNLANTVEFFRDDEGILQYKLAVGKTPIYTYPLTEGVDIAGAPVILEKPFKINGRVPKNLYQICVDTYRHEAVSKAVKNFRGSIGSIYVIMNHTNIQGCGRGDRIVAYYHGKPSSQDDFNSVIFNFAELYSDIQDPTPMNVGYENDEPGDLVGFAKRKKKLKYLADEFELAFDAKLKGSKVNRGHGMHMGSGKDNKRKRQGDLYIKDWLYTVRFIDESGKEVLNLHTINDLGLLQELSGYNPDGNFDRISALRVGIYHQLELMYNETTVKVPQKRNVNAEFFRRPLYTNNTND